MRPLSKKSVTLLELVICIALLGMVVLGFYGMNLFGHYHLISVSKRSQLQNTVSLVLEHMAKEISKGIGDPNTPSIDIATSPRLTIRVWSDTNKDGILNTASGNDQQVSYRFDAAEHEIRYAGTTDCDPFSGCTNYDSFGRKFTAVQAEAQENSLNISVTGCWNPSGDPLACGTMDNPNVTMSTTIRMPAVSAF